AIRKTLSHLQLIEGIVAPAPQSMEGLRLYDVIDKADVDDAFAKPWQSFDAIAKNDLIGTRASGEKVFAPNDGWIVFPNAVAAAGNEWFYLAKANSRFL
ncbi:MAG: succinylglutamate desuccinylase, partial [Casimicrobium sp.]